MPFNARYYFSFHMEALPSSESASGLEYTHKLKPGVTPVSNYGLALARDLKFPPFLVDYAASIERCLENYEAVSLSKIKSDDCLVVLND